MKRSIRRKRLQERILLELTPMVDVVFLLIIFFMVTTTFIDFESGLPIDLPQAQSAEQQNSNLPTVTVNSNQELFVGKTAVTIDQLQDALSQTMSGSDLDIVVLRADAEVPHGLTVQVMDKIKQSGVRRVAIAAATSN